MTARYLIRLDDACPTMDHQRWSRIEALLDSLGVRPLVAVVPDNQDPDLQVDVADPDFWTRVRAWRDKGWTIAMHGYQHRFHFVDRKKLLLPFYDRSEFGGLSFDLQSAKIRASWQIFRAQGVEPTVWIAPAHCFDRTSLQALKAETSIRIISDGIAFDQYHEDGFYWFPQQLWDFVDKSFGLWTVCLHPNSMVGSQINILEEVLSSKLFKDRLVGVSELRLVKKKKSIKDKLYATFFWRRSMIFGFIQSLKNERLLMATHAITSKIPRIRGLGIVLAWIADKFKSYSGSVEVNVFGSKMILTPSDGISRQLIFVPQWYDPDERSLVNKILKPGDYAVDVGANIGAYTLLFAKLVGSGGRVTAIEANRRNFEKLTVNCNINLINNCHLINVGVSDKVETLVFYKNNSGNAGAHSFLKSSDDDKGTSEELALRPLHELIEVKKIKLMKLDIEGFECRVLREYLVKTPRSLWAEYIMLEDEPRHREGNAVELLVKNGYEILKRFGSNVFLKYVLSK